ncbi:MAG TPA: hypothetical protein VF550_03080 [Polyangia bacterium]
MKYTTLTRRFSRRLARTGLAILLFAPGAARAAECPASSPEDPQERRKLAKEWFGIAEAAENGGNDIEATRAYACSYKMVAHPFTAYNLGRVSDRSGDSELALKMFKAYLTLKPDAQDKEEVKGKIKSLEEKIASGTAIVPSPAAASGEEGGEKTAEPPQEELAPPPVPKPTQVVQTPKSVEPESQTPSHVAEWIVGGASAAFLVGGIALNLAARSKMSSCQTDASNPGLLGRANDECNSARPLAYTSYAFFGVAAVGLAVDAVLIILHRGGGESSSGDDSSVGFMVLPGGGGGLTARGRF